MTDANILLKVLRNVKISKTVLIRYNTMNLLKFINFIVKSQNYVISPCKIYIKSLTIQIKQQNRT